MDVSPVQTPKSGSSDFSIERILSDETSSHEAPGAPSWLCCTRYRPPKIPRAVNTACRSRRAGRHARVPFTATQAAALEAAYGRAPYLAPPALRALAAALQLRDDRIKIWFQNRRARERREKCTAITPPQAMTLPALPPTPRSSITAPWTSHSTHALAGLNNQDILTRHLHRTKSLDDEDYCDSLLYETRRDSSEDRSESPLDIETVDE